MQTRGKKPTTRPEKTVRIPDNPEQSKRFMETAREVEAGESAEAFETAFKKVTEPKSGSDKRKERR